MVLETAITYRRLLIAALFAIFTTLSVYFSVADDLDVESFNKRHPESFSGSAAQASSDSESHHTPSNVKPPFPGDSLENLAWFVQVSDIHISKFHWKDIAPDFQDFISEQIQTIQPAAVLVTGDITDAKNEDKQGSQQFEEEWIAYSNVLQNTKVLNKTVWLDTRGNHDAFDVPALSSQENMFKKYSARGKGSYRYEYISKEGNRYSFIAVDACPDPGPRRPFNFFGLVSEEKMEVLKSYAEASQGSNMTLWFGHYPTSIIGSPHPGLRNLLGEGAVYMSGHLHTLGGFVQEMYSPQQAGYLELELGDWKESRLYRVFAVDHDMFSFTDEIYGDSQWTVVMVTNPKNAKFVIPTHEPLARMLRSSHIRILVWSKGPIAEVQVYIDGQSMGKAKHKEGPLYVLPWTPQKYARGLHNIKVIVKDFHGNTKITEQPFSLDGSTVAFDFVRRFLLMSNVALLLKVAFVMAFLVAVLPLLFVRIFIIKVQLAVHNQLTGCLVRFLQTWVRRYYLIAATPRVFYPLILSIVYLVIGPLFVAPILEDHIGACFIWGVYVKGTLIPGTLTYLYVFCHLMTFSVPLTLYVGRCLDLVISDKYKPRPPPLNMPALRWLLDHSVFLLLTTWMLYLSISGFAVTYGGAGYMGLLLCPMRTWSVALAVYLHWVATSNRSRPEMRFDSKRPVEAGSGESTVLRDVPS